MARMTYTTSTSIRSYARLSSKRKTSAKSDCGCPACRGLECMERPRYFAGQLLTEAELNSEQAYVLAKNRLHNRYLHGWGVVCGLEVVCSQCDGWVTVKEGYAIDPCGNDIVVCKQTDFNLIEEIRKCIDARRRAAEVCPPWQDPNADCVDQEDHWCVTIRYIETEARPTMPLRQEGTSTGCDNGCGCGGNGKKTARASATKSGCSCGGGCGDAPSAPKAKARGVACEPTRILEQFRLEIVPQPAECRDVHAKTIGGVATTAVEIDRASQTLRLAAMNQSIGTALLRTFVPDEFFASRWFALGGPESPPDSLFNQIVDIVNDVDEFLAERMRDDELRILNHLFAMVIRDEQRDTGGVIFTPEERSATLFGGIPISQPSTTNNDDRFSLYDFCCRFRRVLWELYAENPLNVRCAGFECPPCLGTPGPTGSTGPARPTGPTGPAVGTVKVAKEGGFVTERFDGNFEQDITFRDGPASLAMSDMSNLRSGATFSTGGGGATGATGMPETRADREPLLCLLNALIDYIVDAVCMKLLPPCPASPCDDRLILACVTIKNDKIVHICNFACRHYAGSFNSLAYWTSVVPVVSAINSVVRKICCAPHALPGLFGLRRRKGRVIDNPGATGTTDSGGGIATPVNPNR